MMSHRTNWHDRKRSLFSKKEVNRSRFECLTKRQMALRTCELFLGIQEDIQMS